MSKVLGARHSMRTLSFYGKPNIELPNVNAFVVSHCVTDNRLARLVSVNQPPGRPSIQ